MDYQAHITREEDQKNNMNISKVYKIDGTKFFEDVERFEDLNNVLIDICKKVFIDAYNSGGKEAGAIFNLRTLEYDFKKAYKYDSISFKSKLNDTDICESILDKAHKHECVTIHTHNSVGTFSIQDILSLLRNDKVCTIVLVDSDANIKILCKDINTNYSALENYLLNYFVDYIDNTIYNQLKQYKLIIKGVN